jgi:hypothetical protein
MIREGIEREETLEEVAQRAMDDAVPSVSTEGLDPVSVARESNGGGGPGRESIAKCVEELKQGWGRSVRLNNEQIGKWQAADSALDEAIRSLYRESGIQERNAR